MTSYGKKGQILIMITDKNCMVTAVAAIIISIIVIITCSFHDGDTVEAADDASTDFAYEVETESNEKNIMQQGIGTNVKIEEETSRQAETTTKTVSKKEKKTETEKKTEKKTEKQTKGKKSYKSKKAEKKTEKAKEVYSTIYHNVTSKDFSNLCRIIESEAGNQGEKGKLLVANVVLNRVKSSKFPDTITSVIFQKGQFQPTWDGNFYKVKVSDETIAVAKKALAGEDLSKGALFFACHTSAGSYFNTKLTLLYQYGAHYFYR